MMGRFVAGVSRFVAAVSLLFTSAHSVSAQPQPGEIEILSKADAVRLFGLTRTQWAQEVRRAVVTGAAQQTPGGDQRIFGMSTTTEEGDLLTVRLDYSQGDKRPVFIQVVAGYYKRREAARDMERRLDRLSARLDETARQVAAVTFRDVR